MKHWPWQKVLFPKECEDVPLVLDPADPTNNVAAVLDNEQWDLSKTAADQVLRDITAAEEKVLGAVPASRAASMVPAASDWTSPPQYQKAVRLQDSWLEQAGGMWEFEATVSSWVGVKPDGSVADRVRVADELVDEDVPGLMMDVWAMPMHLGCIGLACPTSDYNTGMGMELRLNSQKHPWLKVLETLDVPYPGTLQQASSITIHRPSSAPRKSIGDFQVEADLEYDENTIYLDKHITGVLRTDKGLVWEPTRLQWYQLGLCDIGGGIDDDLRMRNAQAEAGCVLSFELNVSFTKPEDD